MFSCWLLSPKDRPSFESLRCELEKTLEDLPDTQDPDEILYVNMDESSMELGAVGGRDPIGGPTPLCLKGLDSVTTVEVHHPNRYVLCPQHETNRALSDSMESLDMPVSSSTATLPLQPSCRSTPNATPAPTPTVELLEDMETSRKMPWQWSFFTLQNDKTGPCQSAPSFYPSQRTRSSLFLLTVRNLMCPCT